MNKFISSIRLFAIMCSLYAGFASASLTEKETQYLDHIESKVQSYVVFSTHWANTFLDMNNNESYAKHINRFKDAFVSFEHDVLVSLRAEKRAAEAAVAPAAPGGAPIATGDLEYKQAIILTHDIVSTLYDQAKHVHTILEKHRKNPNAILLGKDLQAVDKYTKPEVLSGLQAQLRKLQGIFNKIYQSLAKKIGIIIDSLEQRKAKKPNMIEAFKALSYRLNCKN